MKFENIKDKIQNINFLSKEKPYQLPNVKKLLLERYLFTMNKKTYDTLKKKKYPVEVHTRIYEDGLNKFDTGADGEETIYTESWDLLAKRVARRIAVGILGLIDEKNKEYIKNTKYIKQLKKDKDYLYDEIRNMESDFYYAIKEQLFMPSSPFIFNAGRALMDSNEQIFLYLDDINLDQYQLIYEHTDPAYGSCYSMGSIEDDIKSIFDMLYYQAEIFRHAGGFGVNFSKLRSKNAMVNTIKGNSSGPISFMQPFNGNTQLIALSSSLKRGANMFLLDYKHPEIIDFVNMKGDFEDGYQFMKHANISVAIDNDFMDYVYNNKDYYTREPHNNEKSIKINAKKLWDNIVINSALHAEPGIVNFDSINKSNPIRDKEVITSVNPCAEYTGLDQTVCNLASINFYKLLNDKREIEEDLYESVIRTINNFLTLSIYANKYPLEILDHRSKLYRPTGAGFMGLASLFNGLGIKFGSKESLDYEENLMKIYTKTYVLNSQYLGELIGGYKGAESSLMIDGEKQYYPNKENYVFITDKRPLANARLQAIAPTGSISNLCNVSSGVEPIFSKISIRRVNPDMASEYEIQIIDQSILDILKEKSLDYNILYDREKLNENGLDYIVDNNELSLGEHILTLYITSKYIDMSASKTFNILRDTKSLTEEEINKMIELYPDDKLTKALLKYTELKKNKFEVDIKELLFEKPKLYKAYMNLIIKRLGAQNPDDESIKDIQENLFTTLNELNMNNKKELEDFYNQTRKYAKETNLDKTINTVSDFYLISQLLEIKGVTIYVEDTRTPILKVSRKKKEKSNKVSKSNKYQINLDTLKDLGLTINQKTKHLVPKERPKIISCLKQTINIQIDNVTKTYNIEVGYDEENQPFEIFVRPTTSSKDDAPLANVIGRLSSLCLRTGVEPEEILKQLSKVKNWRNEYDPTVTSLTENIRSLMEIAKAKGSKRKRLIKEGNKIPSSWVYDNLLKVYIDEDGNKRCPSCGEIVYPKAGCIDCDNCGWSKCD